MRHNWTSLAALLGALLAMGAGAGLQAAGPANPTGISGKTLAGDAFDVRRESGQVVIINFWATWCLPCRAEMPSMDSFYMAHHSQGLEMIAISMDEPSKSAAVKSIAANFHFAVAMSRDVRIPAPYRPSQLPVTLVFGRDGRLRFDSRRSPGLMTQPQLDRIVGPLLAEAGR